MAVDLVMAKATKFAEIHRRALENIGHLGDIDSVWTDEEGNLCIRYSCGEWYHYRLSDEILEWW